MRAGLVTLSLLFVGVFPALADPPLSPTSQDVSSLTPRSHTGRPELQGEVWAVNFLPVFEASPMADTLVVSEEKARSIAAMMVGGMSKQVFFEIDPEAHVILGETDGLPIVRGERRSRQVVVPATGRAPMTPDARARVKAFDGLDPPEKDGPEQRPPGERCLAQNPPPMASTLTYTRMRFIVTSQHVVIHSEAGDETRIIPFADAPNTGLARDWMGDSAAHWDGDTLVIETVNHPREMRVRAVPTMVVEPTAHVIERITRITPDELLYQYSVLDAGSYSEPWLAEFSLFRSNTGMFPSPCHEGNYSLPNILRAARIAEERERAR
jgi:hypothetical protein